MTEFQVRDERERLGHGDVSECLEAHHGDWSAGEHVTEDHFRDDVQADLLRSDSLDDTDRHNVNGSKDDGEAQSPNGELSAVDLDGGDSHAERDEEDGSVPPVRHFLVAGHEARVDVRLFREGSLKLADNVFAVVEAGVGDGCRDGSETEAVGDEESGGEVLARVTLVFRIVKRLFGGEDVPGRVSVTETVVRERRREGEVSGVVHVLCPDDRRDEADDDEVAKHDVCLCEPGDHEWREEVRGDDGPVKADWEETDTARCAEDDIDTRVVGGDPSDP